MRRPVINDHDRGHGSPQLLRQFLIADWPECFQSPNQVGFLRNREGVFFEDAFS
jgi:hypothetical protein